MRRTLLILSGVLVLALLAGGLTEVALAIGHRSLIVDDAPSRKTNPSPKATPKTTPSPTPSAVATPVVTPTPVATPVVPTATTNGFVRLRTGASTSTPVLAELNGGTVVILGTYQDAQWQEVTVNGVHGYIYRSYLAY